MAYFIQKDDIKYTAPSFKEMMQPLLMLKEEYDKVRKEYEQNEERNAAIEALIGSDPATQQRQYMQPYFDAKENLADAIYNATNLNDLRAASRKAFELYNDRGLKAQAAMQRLGQQEKMWNDTKGAIGNRLTFNDFIANPLAQPAIISGNEVQQQAASLAKNIAKGMPSEEAGRILNGAFIRMRQGWTREQIDEAMRREGTYSEDIGKLYDLYGGIYNTLNDEEKEKFDSYVSLGLYSGLQDEQIMRNPDYMDPYQRLNYSKLQKDMQDENTYRDINIGGKTYKQNRKGEVFEYDDKTGEYFPIFSNPAKDGGNVEVKDLGKEQAMTAKQSKAAKNAMYAGEIGEQTQVYGEIEYDEKGMPTSRLAKFPGDYALQRKRNINPNTAFSTFRTLQDENGNMLRYRYDYIPIQHLVNHTSSSGEQLDWFPMSEDDRSYNKYMMSNSGEFVARAYSKDGMDVRVLSQNEINNYIEFNKKTIKNAANSPNNDVDAENVMGQSGQSKENIQNRAWENKAGRQVRKLDGRLAKYIHSNYGNDGVGYAVSITENLDNDNNQTVRNQTNCGTVWKVIRTRVQ